MFKVKKSGWVFVFIAVIGLIFYGDFSISKDQENHARVRVNGHDIIGAYAARLQPGMTQDRAESAISGYRQISIYEAAGETTVTYRFWYGFIPPLPVLRYKISGKISVTYSAEYKVTKVAHWYS